MFLSENIHFGCHYGHLIEAILISNSNQYVLWRNTSGKHTYIILTP